VLTKQEGALLTQAGVRALTLLAPESSTKRLPELLSSRAEGALKAMLKLLLLSTLSLEPLPAKEVTTPEGVTLRMRLFCESATSTEPQKSCARPRGALN
jgi:hypothetical protein